MYTGEVIHKNTQRKEREQWGETGKEQTIKEAEGTGQDASACNMVCTLSAPKTHQKGAENMEIITICAFKGGSGKTTTAQTLAAGLSGKGFRVLAVDTDRQTNLTTHSGINANQCKANIFTLFCDIKDERPLNVQEAIVKAEAYDLIPATNKLDDADFIFYSAIQWQGAIKSILEQVANQYDYCIIDTNTNPGLMTRAAIYAADKIIIPIEPSIDHFQGLAQVIKRVNDIRKEAAPALKIDGILLVKTNLQTTAHKMTYNQITQFAEAVGVRVYKSFIRKASAVEESQIIQQSIFEYAPKSKPAGDYTNFINEFLKGEAEQ